MFFNPSPIIELNYLLNFITSKRGGGKTFSTVKTCIEDFLKTGEQFIYCRRTAIELERAKDKLFEAYQVEGYFNSIKFMIKDYTIYANDKVCGYIIALSTAYQLKSVSFAKVTKIVFDEFISENNKYLKDEPEKLLSLMETVGRLRDIQVILLGNQKSIYNPYYVYFNIKPSEADLTKFKNKSILIYNFNSKEFLNKKLETKFGKLISNTKYGQFLLENQAIDDSLEFINKLTGISKKAIANIIIEKTNIIIYEYLDIDKFKLFFKIGKTIEGILTINYDSLLNESADLQSVRNNVLTQKIKQYINTSRISFNDIRTRNLILNTIFN